MDDKGSKMALLPGSYARLAGIQSEISKVTVTRVAGNEVQYRRSIDSYRKDMCMNINSINHQQRKLRQTLRRYTNVKRQNRMEKEKRRQAELRAKVNIEALAYIAARPVEIVAIDIINDVTDDVIDEEKDKDENDRRENSEKESTDHENEYNEGDISVDMMLRMKTDKLELIPEAEEPRDNDDDNDDNRDDETPARVSKESTLILPPIVVKRRKKVGVSYADLIKLQHGPSTKKLISLVDKMAKQHEQGISELKALQRLKNKLPDTRDNAFFKGGHGEVFSQDNNSLMRTAAIIYPIKYGYGSQADIEDDTDIFGTISNSRSSVIDPPDVLSFWENASSENSYDAAKTKHRRVSRHKVHPDFTGYMKNVNNRQTRPPVQAVTQRVTQSYLSQRYSSGKGYSGSIPNLPSINSNRVVFQEDSRSKTWQNAFQKLKMIHSLSEEDIF